MIATCGDIPQCDEEPALAPHGPNWTWWLAHFILDSINTQLNFLATTSLQTRLQILRERLNVIC